MCKKGVKAVLESDKLILSKNGVFVGKEYSCDGMFKLCMSNINNNKLQVFAFIADSPFTLWHNRLAHVIFYFLKLLSNHGLIVCNKIDEKKM